MFRMSTSLLKGELGQQTDSRDGLKWLKLAAKYANDQYPQALYDLAMLHDAGLKSLIWADHKYMIELLTRASELQHAPSQYLLGQAYEYGRYDQEKNPAKSVYFYSLAASNNHVEVSEGVVLIIVGHV
jgi:TPR repeat protein